MSSYGAPRGDHALAQGGGVVGRDHDRPVPQADHAGRHRRGAAAAPDVEAEVVVVAAGGHERGRVEQRHHLEADDVAVEREAAVDVADVQVHVADDRLGRDVRLRLLVLDEAHQPGEVERRGAAEHGRVGDVAPRLAAAVGGELDAVVVGVGQVDRLGDVVIGRAADARARDGEAGGGAGELEPRGMQEREVVEAGVAPGGRARPDPRRARAGPRRRRRARRGCPRGCAAAGRSSVS